MKSLPTLGVTGKKEEIQTHKPKTDYSSFKNTYLTGKIRFSQNIKEHRNTTRLISV